MMDTIESSVIQIKTDEEYNKILKEVTHPEIIVDFRFDKYIVICSLDFFHRDRPIQLLPILYDFIKNHFDNVSRLPDKIYILKLGEATLDLNHKMFTQIIEKGFLFTIHNARIGWYREQNVQPECIFINGDLAVTSNVKEYDKHGTYDDFHSMVKTYGYPFYLLARTRTRITELNANNKITDYNITSTKHFICLNGVPQSIRAEFLTWLHETNIIDKCHWSWLRRNSTDEGEKSLGKSNWTNTAIFDFRKTKELDMSCYELETHINQDRVDDFYYLTDSLIDIGIETNPNHQFITEKTWKPYLHGKVSFFFNCQSYYAILKNLGFELYDEIFNYSFDTIKDREERQTAYYNEVKRISEIPIKELQKKILSIKDKILRNRNHAWNCDLNTMSLFKEYPMLIGSSPSL